LRGNLEPNCRQFRFLQGCRARLPGKTAGQGCRARLPGKAAGQGCRARLPGKAAGQGCRARLLGKAAGQGCRAMVEYAKSMVKLDNFAYKEKKKRSEFSPRHLKISISVIIKKDFVLASMHRY
jgi:hypothetical protein